MGASLGAWLSLVERCVRDAEVAGSNPVAPISPRVLAQRSGLPRSTSTEAVQTPALRRAGPVLVESHIKNPMQRILDGATPAGHICGIAVLRVRGRLGRK
jgi:hypothetical protein